MPYLFYIDKKNNTVLHEDCVRLIPELGTLNEQETLVIVLAYDYHSPYHQFPLEDRQRKALIHVYKGSSPEGFFKKKKIEVAIEAYKSLQYNHKRETIIKYREKVDLLTDLLMDTNEEKKIKEITSSTKELRRYIKELEEEVDSDVFEEGKITGNKELSWLEQMKENQDYYKSVIKPKK